MPDSLGIRVARPIVTTLVAPCLTRRFEFATAHNAFSTEHAKNCLGMRAAFSFCRSRAQVTHMPVRKFEVMCGKWGIACWLMASLVLLLAAGGAAPARGATVRPVPHSRRESFLKPQSIQRVEGRVVAVRRLSREVSVLTPDGTVRHIAVAPDTKIAAHGAAGLNAVRSGAMIQTEALAGPNGTLTARTVAVRPYAGAPH